MQHTHKIIKYRLKNRNIITSSVQRQYMYHTLITH